MWGPKPTCLVVNGPHMCLLPAGHAGAHDCFDECNQRWGDDDGE